MCPGLLVLLHLKFQLVSEEMELLVWLVQIIAILLDVGRALEIFPCVYIHILLPKAFLL